MNKISFLYGVGVGLILSATLFFVAIQYNKSYENKANIEIESNEQNVDVGEDVENDVDSSEQNDSEYNNENKSEENE